MLRALSLLLRAGAKAVQMLGELTNEQIEHVLRSAVTGHIGCHAEGRTYVVPVSYVYDGEHVYAHSADGLKIRTMRSNPNVCFQVEEVDNLVNWRSVIGWGRYEELSGAEEDRARRRLDGRFAPLLTSETASSSTLPRTGEGLDEGVHRSIYYRIRLVEKAGRFEKR